MIHTNNKTDNKTNSKTNDKTNNKSNNKTMNHMIFHYSYHQNNLDDIKNLDYKNSDIYNRHPEFFPYICRKGYFEMVKFFVSLEQKEYLPIPATILQVSFKKACYNNQLEIAQYLFDLSVKYQKWTSYQLSFFFYQVSHRGHTKTAKWLASLEPDYGDINIYFHTKDLFRTACTNDNLDMLQLLLDMDKTHQNMYGGIIDTFGDRMSLFTISGRNNNTKILKYLLDNLDFSYNVYRYVLMDVIFCMGWISAFKVVMEHPKCPIKNQIWDNQFYTNYNKFQIRHYLLKKYPDYTKWARYHEANIISYREQIDEICIGLGYLDLYLEEFDLCDKNVISIVVKFILD